MTKRGVGAFVEAILADQPPKQFRAAYENADVLRVAVELRASRSGGAGPGPMFVEQLHRSLGTIANDSVRAIPLSARGRRSGEHERRSARGFAGAIGAEEARDPSGEDIEAEVIHGHGLAVAFGQFSDLDAG
jgi:hypothetical protein